MNDSLSRAAKAARDALTDKERAILDKRLGARNRVLVQFGAGNKKYTHFQNSPADIRNTLPFRDSSVDFILTEHVIEHINPNEAMHFFAEAWRVLRPGGTIRLAFPNPLRIEQYNDETQKRYDAYISESRHALDQRTLKRNQQTRLNMILNFDHRALWSAEMLMWALKYSSFEPKEVQQQESAALAELLDNPPKLDKRCADRDLSSFETSVVEGRKL